MTIEETETKLGGENDKFPVGMRVLAVDDDLACLKLLEVLLKKCQYEVTTTDQAKVALKMVRENRNKFDIIISDVHMSDMNGFKLLELVGLQMDLPVIMLSANSDPKLVMKGITHGACDYLVKPVRLEEIKNIWQHVIRRKRSEPKQQNFSDSQVTDQGANGEIANRTCPNGSSDQNGKRPNRKRKDEEEAEQEGEDNGTDNDEPRTQKKPRVVWFVELHEKFVAAVYQLGLKKAVPKKILELMNVEGITRENVASHLQKYRLYLKRISSATTEEKIISGLGGKDPYMRMNSVDGVGDFRDLPSSQGIFSNSAMSSYQTGSILNRLNTPSGVSLIGLSSSSPLIQANNHGQSISNSFSTLSKVNPVVSQQKQNSSPFEVNSKPLEITQLQTSKNTSHTGNINLNGSSINYLASTQRNILPTQNGEMFSNQSSELVTPSAGSNSIYDGVFSNFSSNPSSSCEAFNRNLLVPNGILENNCPPGGHILNKSVHNSSTDVISTSVHDSREEGLFGNFKTVNNVVLVNSVISPFSQSFDQNRKIFQKKVDLPSIACHNSDSSAILQRSGSEELAVESKSKPNGHYFLEQWRSQGGFGDNGYDALDALLNSMTKGENEGNMMMDGESGMDDYTF